MWPLAIAVAAQARRDGVADPVDPAAIRARMWSPEYVPYRRAATAAPL